MRFKNWQVGLDIQNGSVQAIGLLHQRQGWQLRHWWRAELPENTLDNGVLRQPEMLQTRLNDWRKTLPRSYHLRVGFPAQHILQRQVPLPDNRLREPARSQYIASASARQLQMLPENISWDNDTGQPITDKLLVTAARRQDVSWWLRCLAAAGLVPEVLSPTPVALSVLARNVTDPTTRYVLHDQGDHWLWASVQPAGGWGWIRRDDAPDVAALCAHLSVRCDEILWNSGTGQAPFPDARLLQPLAAIRLFQPPLPSPAGAFALAAGLALWDY